MPGYKVGDDVVHWAYGRGTIVAITDKGAAGQPCFYYIIEGSQRTLWVPVEEIGGSSLHLLTSRSDFKEFINILRSQGEKMSNNPFQRQKQLDERMHKASPKDLCMVIRDLSFQSRWEKLNSGDTRVLKHAQSVLLDEWELSLGTSREKARHEMGWILKEARARQNTYNSHRHLG